MVKHAIRLLVLACLSFTAVRASLLFRRHQSEGLRGALNGTVKTSSAAPVPPLTPVGPSTPIKFLIAAFQDGERCAKTLHQALSKAQHPERVTFNVLQAAAGSDTLCLEEFSRKHAPELCGGSSTATTDCIAKVVQKVRVMVIPPEQGEGPVHSRGLLSEFADLSGDGSMCLATDAHMDFAQGWDQQLLEDWASTENEFAVLSAYPYATSQMSLAGTRSWIELCGYFLTDRGLPRGATGRPMVNDYRTGSPQLTMNWAAGQSFARCHAEKNVPVDKNLVWMFDGEEVNRAVRFWTHGYDMYNPRVNVVLHDYSHAVQKFWSYGKADMPSGRDASEARLKSLLQEEAPQSSFGKYGLGNQRSLEQYVTWARTNLGGKWRSFLASKNITPHFADFVHNGVQQPTSVAEFCSTLQRQPVHDEQALIASARAASTV